MGKGTAKAEHSNMRKFTLNLTFLALGLQLWTGCAVLQTSQPVTELASLQNQRAVNTLFALSEMREIDTLIKLDNQQLESQFARVLKTQAESFDTYDLHKLKFDFTNQIIFLEALFDIKDEFGNRISANLSGDINLQYRGTGLEWQPRFRQLQISSRDFVFAGDSYVEASAELGRVVLENLNRDIARPVIEKNLNSIPVKPLPLGEIQVGASLPRLTGATASITKPLRGLFMVAGSALMIDSAYTSIALDLAFIPDISTCPADVTVSRAEFTADVRSREPAGIVRTIQDSADVRYFYSEITGAKRPLAIVHYWFADGMPQTAAELPVGPSERWRTWSENTAAQERVSQWEVLVVEKESGCILASKSIRTLASENLITRVNGEAAMQSFNELKSAFDSKTSDFSIAAEKPGIALIEVRRAFLRDVLQASLADLSLAADFDEASLFELQSSAELQAFDSDSIVCEHRDCEQAPLCKINLVQCKRLRDTRDCSSCQFRNPLNNRCVSEAIDPLCEASRNRQNARYEEERNACIERAENEKKECDRLNAQTFESCRIESGFNESACTAVKAGLKTMSDEAPLARLSAVASAKGGRLGAHFTKFRIEGDLERLKLDMSLHSNLQLSGKLGFEPIAGTQPLAKCIEAWKAPFKSRFTSTPAFNNLLSDLEAAPDMLTAQWSGFGVSIETQPSPLESMFVDNPQLLASCKIGLTVSKVEAAIAGGDAAFFRGQTELVLQPSPTRIHLAPATIEFGGMVYSANARLGARQLRYDIGE